jgi:hypothetical protein
LLRLDAPKDWLNTAFEPFFARVRRESTFGTALHERAHEDRVCRLPRTSTAVSAPAPAQFASIAFAVDVSSRTTRQCFSASDERCRAFRPGRHGNAFRPLTSGVEHFVADDTAMLFGL